MKVCIDPGHGGKDHGAIAPDGTREKDIALNYATALGNRLLRAGHGVMLTRSTDGFLGLSERAQIANDWGADCLVSIHANAASSAAANGAWVIYDDRTSMAGGIALAESIFRRMAEVPGIADADDAGEVYADRTPWVGGRDLTVISKARMPAVLVELGFLTNPDDLAQLLRRDTLREVVDGISRGILEWGGESLDPEAGESPDPVVDLVGERAGLYEEPELPEKVHPLRRPVAELAAPGETGEDFLRRLGGVLSPVARYAWGIIVDRLTARLERETDEALDKVLGK